MLPTNNMNACSSALQTYAHTYTHVLQTDHCSAILASCNQCQCSMYSTYTVFINLTTKINTPN